MLNANMFSTLLRHHWRRTRWWLLAPVLMSVAVGLTVYPDILSSKQQIMAWWTFKFGLLANLNILTLAAMAFTAGFGFGESDSVMPRYAQSLPVSNRRWTLSHIVYSLLVFGAIAAVISFVDWQAWTRTFPGRPTEPPATVRMLERTGLPPANLATATLNQDPVKAIKNWRGRHPLGPRKPRLTQPWERFDFRTEPLLLLSTAFLCQALFLAITLIPRPVLRIVLSGLVWLLPFTIFNAALALRHDWRAALLYAFCIVVGVAILRWAVSRARHGGRNRFSPGETLDREVVRPRLRLTTPERALMWYDWKTFGRYLICGSAVAAIALPFAGIIDGTKIPTLTGLSVLPAAGLAGLYLAYRLYFGERQDNDAYLVTMPVRVEWLSQRRLANTGISVFVASALGVFIEAWVVSAWFVDLPEPSSYVYISPVAAWLLVWLAGPLLYPGILLWVILGATCTLALGGDDVGLVLAAVVVGILGVAAGSWTLWQAMRRRLVQTWNEKGAFYAVIISGLFVVPVLLYARDLDAVPAVARVIGSGMCLLAAVPFIGLPLAIDRYRHQR